MILALDLESETRNLLKEATVVIKSLTNLLGNLLMLITGSVNLG